MRQRVTRDRLERFMAAFADGTIPARIYLVGGATAVLFNWRDSTVDVDLKLVPDTDEVLRVLPKLKERLQINIELAAPDDFIPALPGWQERSRFIKRQGAIDFFHYDFYGQALAKIERGHQQDLTDVNQMLKMGLIEPQKMWELFLKIQGELYKYPAINQESFRSDVENFVRKWKP
ncbi:MAG TPA: DUF6036 family nucleotidyltransferase [Pyrinomonadaceae bacterium]